MSKAKLIAEKLGLVTHRQGGYFRRTYQSPITFKDRHLLTSIYYMVTRQSPVTAWHMNKSDVLHFHHQGGRLRYLVIYPEDGRLQQHYLSDRILQGQSTQLLVRGNTWKACYLQDKDYGLISQAVSPGFDYADNTLITHGEMLDKFPQHKETLQWLQNKKPTKV